MIKKIVITGANSGIGKAMTKAFLTQGHNVIMIARDSEKTKKIYNEFKSYLTNNTLELITGDLSQPKDIRKILDTLDDTIDILINNAGLIKRKKTMSIENYEMTTAVNYIAPYRITMGLIEKGIQVKRVINVTSALYKKGKVDINAMLNPTKYKGQQVYSNTKKALLMFSNELFNLYGKEIEVIAIHPGVVATSAFRDYPKWFIKLLNRFLEKPEVAAQKIVELALLKKIKNGYYYNQNTEVSSLSKLVNEQASKTLFNESKRFN
jgi:short-subunit dehydrogenase